MKSSLWSLFRRTEAAAPPRRRVAGVPVPPGQSAMLGTLHFVPCQDQENGDGNPELEMTALMPSGVRRRVAGWSGASGVSHYYVMNPANQNLYHVGYYDQAGFHGDGALPTDWIHGVDIGPPPGAPGPGLFATGVSGNARVRVLYSNYYASGATSSNDPNYRQIMASGRWSTPGTPGSWGPGNLRSGGTYSAPAPANDLVATPGGHLVQRSSLRVGSTSDKGLYSWNGSRWITVATGAYSSPASMVMTPGGKTVARSSLRPGQTSEDGGYVWNGVDWIQTGTTFAAPAGAPSIVIDNYSAGAPAPQLVAGVSTSNGGSLLWTGSGWVPNPLTLPPYGAPAYGVAPYYGAPPAALTLPPYQLPGAALAPYVGQTSPDGQSQWNGAGWVPVSSAAALLAPQGAPGLIDTGSALALFQAGANAAGAGSAASSTIDPGTLAELAAAGIDPGTAAQTPRRWHRSDDAAGRRTRRRRNRSEHPRRPDRRPRRRVLRSR